MASLRDMSVFMQALVAVAVAVVLTALGVFVPGSPTARERDVVEADEFIRLIQGAAIASSVQIRSLKSLAIVPKEYHYEMPFEIQADGPYFNVLDFFGRLGRLSRIINVGDLAFDAPENSKGTKFPVHPGTTVSGTFTATTFFTKPADSGGAPAAGAKPGSVAGKP